MDVLCLGWLALQCIEGSWHGVFLIDEPGERLAQLP